MFEVVLASRVTGAKNAAELVGALRTILDAMAGVSVTSVDITLAPPYMTTPNESTFTITGTADAASYSFMVGRLTSMSLNPPTRIVSQQGP